MLTWGRRSSMPWALGDTPAAVIAAPVSPVTKLPEPGPLASLVGLTVGPQTARKMLCQGEECCPLGTAGRGQALQLHRHGSGPQVTYPPGARSELLTPSASVPTGKCGSDRGWQAEVRPTSWNHSLPPFNGNELTKILKWF